MKRLLAAGAAVLALAGCNITDPHARWLWNTPDEGIVHDHSFTPAHYNYGQSCSGNPQICIPTQTYIPDDWSLDLYADDGDHGWTSVSENAYTKCLIGQRYPECQNDAT